MFFADTILVIHALYIAFVVGGLLATVLGLLRGWGWVRNVWFRGIHLLAVGFVVVLSWFDIACPLTILENELRVRAGQAGYHVGFIATWLRRAIFYDADPAVFVVVYTLFGAAVVATWIWGRPRRSAGG